MEKNHKGLIISYDVTGAEREVETSGLNKYLKEIGVHSKTDLKHELCNRLQGSANRSVWFMYFNYRQFTLQEDVKKEYYMPICGVKEQPDVSRAVKYVEWLTFPAQYLDGMGFNDIIFGLDFVNSRESVHKSDNELREIISGRRRKVAQGIDSRNVDSICRILYSIWFTLKRDPMSRVVIIMDNPEMDSMELLRQLYLLIPSRLRLQMGFMTNVTAEDVKIIGEGKGLPIYVMTASTSDWETIKQHRESYSIKLCPIVVSKLEQLSFDHKILNLLRRLAKDMSPQIAACFDYVEKKVIERNGENTNSFKCYEEILKNVFSEEMFWWRKEKIESVEDLRRLYYDQIELMRNEIFRVQAFNTFFAHLYVKNNLTSQILNIVNDNQYPKREELLDFLSEEMGMKNQIEDMRQFCYERTTEKDRDICITKQDLEKDYKTKTDLLKEELSGQIEKEKQQHQQEIGEKNDAIKDLKTQIEEIKNDAENDRTKFKNDLDNKAEEIRLIVAEKNNLIEEKQNLENELQQKISALEGMEDADGTYYKLLELEKQHEKVKKNEKELLDKTNTLKRFVIILSAACMLFVIMVIAFFCFNSELKKDKGMLLEQNVRYKRRIATLIEDIEAVKDENSTGDANTTENKEGADDIVNNEGDGEEQTEGNDVSNNQDEETEPVESKPIATTETAWESEEVVEILKEVNNNLFAIKKDTGTLYFHVKFANSDEGSKDFGDKTGGYIGTYVDDNPSDETSNLARYYWRKNSGKTEFKGYLGNDSNYNEYFLHIAFSKSEDGKKGFSLTKITNRKYIGFYIDSLEKDSTNYSDYGWKEIPEKRTSDN